MRALAGAWLEALEKGELNPPRDVHDASGWNTYWSKRLGVGALDQGFSDMMSSDDTLIDLLLRRNARTILCAGNGMSSEALSLAMHGFQVTALDISSIPGRACAEALQRPAHPASGIPGFRITDDVFVFGASGPIPVDACPPIHRNAPRAGGTLTFAVGDLIDPTICPGPFDVVIERRTVQLFPKAEREIALDRLAARLADRGMLVSHMHDGAGGPGRARPHPAREWAVSRGFVLDAGLELEARRAATRLARVVLTTG